MVTNFSNKDQEILEKLFYFIIGLMIVAVIMFGIVALGVKIVCYILGITFMWRYAIVGTVILLFIKIFF